MVAKWCMDSWKENIEWNQSRSQNKETERCCCLLIPKIYNAEHFWKNIHYNQNEKLGMFGVVHVWAPDGFFGKVVGHAAMARRNNLEIYEEVYRFMITFFIYNDNVFHYSQIFWRFQ